MRHGTPKGLIRALPGHTPKHVVEFGTPLQQVLDGQVASPTQAQMLHHFKEPDSMRVARGHG